MYFLIKDDRKANFNAWKYPIFYFFSSFETFRGGGRPLPPRGAAPDHMHYATNVQIFLVKPLQKYQIDKRLLTLPLKNLTKPCRDYLQNTLHVVLRNHPSLSIAAERLTCLNNESAWRPAGDPRLARGRSGVQAPAPACAFSPPSLPSSLGRYFLSRLPHTPMQVLLMIILLDYLKYCKIPCIKNMFGLLIIHFFFQYEFLLCYIDMFYCFIHHQNI